MYKLLYDYCQEINGNNWEEKFEYQKLVSKPGKQGVVGFLKPTKEPFCEEDVVFKFSQHINYLVQHESSVMDGLNQLESYCPHFCKYLGQYMCKVDPKHDGENPFKISAKYPIYKEVMLCENISNSYKFYNYIRSVQKVDEEELYSIIKQVLMAIIMAQKKKFTHYDLHSFNIMVNKCQDTVNLYVIDEDNQFAVYNHGNLPIIIDFGFSYIEDLDDGPLWPSLGHTDVGFISDRFDCIADAKLFLITVANEIFDKRNSKKSKVFKRVVKNIFKKLDIDWDSGWDNYDKSAHHVLYDLLDGHNPGSVLFEKYIHYCVDIFQPLIIMPMESQDYTNLGKSYSTFVREFIKIENQISSHFYNLYILKCVVNAAMYVRSSYIDNDTRDDAVKTFKKLVNNHIDEIGNFCNTATTSTRQGVHFEKMLCSLLVFGRCMEGVLYKVVSKRSSEKEKEYKKLPISSTEQIYGIIDTNFPTEYTYTKDTIVKVYDSINKCTDEFTIPETYLECLNKTHNITKGTYLYDIYKNIKIE